MNADNWDFLFKAQTLENMDDLIKLADDYGKGDRIDLVENVINKRVRIPKSLELPGIALQAI